MADLVAADVTITNVNGEKLRPEDLVVIGRERRGSVKLTFGDGVKTYPSGGVPLPSIGNFGMIRDLKMLKVYAGEAGIEWDYDKTNHTLRAYIQGFTVSAAGGATMDDYAVNPTGDALASATSLSLANTVVSGTYYLGKLKELGVSPAAGGGQQAVPAQTLYCEVDWPSACGLGQPLTRP